MKSCIAHSSFVFLLASPLSHAGALQPGKGNFTFIDESVAPGRPVTVWYYKPAGLGPQVKVMFVMHGADRRADQYRDQWIRHAEKYQLLVLAPEFAEKYFPIDEYQFGNVTEARMERWNFWIIEHLFDDIRRREGLAARKFYLFGHSAGAQFVHRYMLFMPAPRVEMAFAANAGSYTMPVYSAAFPMSLERTQVSEERLAPVFARRLVVMLGEQDIDEHDESLPRSPQAMAQGRNRFERGQAFFRLAQHQAAARHASFHWKLVTVPQVGHDHSGMAQAALRYFFTPAASMRQSQRAAAPSGD